jgi:hypothetical protein
MRLLYRDISLSPWANICFISRPIAYAISRLDGIVPSDFLALQGLKSYHITA